MARYFKTGHLYNFKEIDTRKKPVNPKIVLLFSNVHHLFNRFNNPFRVWQVFLY
jgi:hypothetical protein